MYWCMEWVIRLPLPFSSFVYLLKCYYCWKASILIFHFLPDLLQIDIDEDYRHLSFKTLSGYHWIGGHAQNINWIIKTDDDITVDWHQLLISLDQAQTKAQCSHLDSRNNKQ